MSSSRKVVLQDYARALRSKFSGLESLLLSKASGYSFGGYFCWPRRAQGSQNDLKRGYLREESRTWRTRLASRR